MDESYHKLNYTERLKRFQQAHGLNSNWSNNKCLNCDHEWSRHTDWDGPCGIARNEGERIDCPCQNFTWLDGIIFLSSKGLLETAHNGVDGWFE